MGENKKFYGPAAEKLNDALSKSQGRTAKIHRFPARKGSQPSIQHVVLPDPEHTTDPEPKQLDFFHTILSTFDDKNTFSNTIDVWDAAPKYYLFPYRSTNNPVPAALERTFEHRKRRFTLRVSAATDVDRTQPEKFFSPGPREELIEDALRKIALDSGTAFGASFTIRQLRSHLKELGHTFSHAQIVEALAIMHRCRVELRNEDDTVMASAPILPAVGARSRAHYLKDPTAKYTASFHPLVSEGIKRLAYRQYDYLWMSSFSTPLSRHLFKRLSHIFIQAGLTQDYDIRFSALARDTALLENKNRRQARNKLAAAFDELRERQVLRDWQVIKTFTERCASTGRPAVTDVLYKLSPASPFIRQALDTNLRAKHIQLLPPPKF
jgi:hypothetical protein